MAGAVSLVAVVLTVVPYLVAASMARERGVFGGFLINPVDGFSYLAKMRQGLEGAWLLRLPYAAEPGQGAFLFVYQLVLGHIAGVLHAPLLSIYHAARALGAMVMFLTAFAFFEWILPDRRARWTAFVLTAFGSGLGWLALPTGLVGTDLWIPESIPFLSAYSNAHFPLAAAGVLAAVMLVAKPGTRERRRAAAALGVGFVLGAIQPFVVLSSGLCLIVWMVWEAMIRKGAPALVSIWRTQSAVLLPTAAYFGGAAPWIMYDLLIVRTNPVLAVWNAQNQTPSPPPFDYMLGYGVVLILAVVGIVARRQRETRLGRLLITWVVVTAILLYVPISLQRRLSLGLFFPLAALAALGLEAIDKRWRLFGPAIALTLILSVPSNILVIFAGLDGVARLEPTVVLTRQESDAYDWFAEHAPPESLVLAGSFTGNRLPAFADVRVVYGHPFETPYAAEARDWIAAQYSWSGLPAEGIGALRARGVRYVYFGPEELSIGTPTWLDQLPLVFSEGDVSIREVSGP